MKMILYAIVAFLFVSCNSTPSKKAAVNTTDTDNSWALLPFVKKDSVNPVLLPDANQIFTCPILKTVVKWEEKDVFNPAAIVRNDTIFLLYRAEDIIGKHAGTSRIGLAWSTDGLHFTKHKTPVLYPDNDAQKWREWEGGCEDPRLVQDESGIYYMTYTAYDGDKARLFIASSPDLYNWTKHGHAFQKAYGGKYTGGWSKSGAIVSTYKNGKITATKINGTYWMYWGDVNIWAATSPDLINWTPVLYADGEKRDTNLRHNAVEIPEIKTVFGPRKGMFDSDLVEPGPPAMLTENGIVLIYNSRNVKVGGDSTLAEGTYTPAQILLDKNDPLKVLKRMDTYFMKPDKPYEIAGQVAHVCFLESLVQHKNKWYLYYGTADSKIAVAVKD